jgi:predicted glycosyltransferase
MNIAKEYSNVNTITEGLYDTIYNSDLTVTIRSNVGLESMIIGTPAVCFNFESWGPFALDQTYALTDDVPVYTSKKEFQTFINQLDRDRLSRLQDRQREYVEQNYYLDSDCAAKMAEYIKYH